MTTHGYYKNKRTIGNWLVRLNPGAEGNCVPEYAGLGTAREGYLQSPEVLDAVLDRMATLRIQRLYCVVGLSPRGAAWRGSAFWHPNTSSQGPQDYDDGDPTDAITSSAEIANNGRELWLAFDVCNTNDDYYDGTGGKPDYKTGAPVDFYNINSADFRDRVSDAIGEIVSRHPNIAGVALDHFRRGQTEVGGALTTATASMNDLLAQIKAKIPAGMPVIAWGNYVEWANQGSDLREWINDGDLNRSIQEYYGFLGTTSDRWRRMEAAQGWFTGQTAESAYGPLDNPENFEIMVGVDNNADQADLAGANIDVWIQHLQQAILNAPNGYLSLYELTRLTDDQYEAAAALILDRPAAGAVTFDWSGGSSSSGIYFRKYSDQPYLNTELGSQGDLLADHTPLTLGRRRVRNIQDITGAVPTSESPWQAQAGTVTIGPGNLVTPHGDVNDRASISPVILPTYRSGVNVQAIARIRVTTTAVNQQVRIRVRNAAATNSVVIDFTLASIGTYELSSALFTRNDATNTVIEVYPDRAAGTAALTVTRHCIYDVTELTKKTVAEYVFKDGTTQDTFYTTADATSTSSGIVTDAVGAALSTPAGVYIADDALYGLECSQMTCDYLDETYEFNVTFGGTDTKDVILCAAQASTDDYWQLVMDDTTPEIRFERRCAGDAVQSAAVSLAYSDGDVIRARYVGLPHNALLYVTNVTAGTKLAVAAPGHGEWRHRMMSYLGARMGPCANDLPVTARSLISRAQTPLTFLPTTRALF